MRVTFSNRSPLFRSGQIELVEHLQASGRHHTHCISIGNPRSIFSRRCPDNTVPRIIKKGFDKVLRLNFGEHGAAATRQMAIWPMQGVELISISHREEISRWSLHDP